MAVRSQYQYQAVTGPVFTGIVAATLAWLPTGNPQPTRTRLPVQTQQGTVQPFTAALYKMERLEWTPRGIHQPTRKLDPIQSQQGMVEPFVEATRYRWERLEWIPSGNSFVRALPPNKLGDFQQPSEAVRYHHERLEWVPKGQWQPARTRDPVQTQQGTVQPITQALYKMERLEWMPKGAEPQFQLPPNRLGWVVLDPFPRLTPFDPTQFPIIQILQPRALDRFRPQETVEPFSDAVAVATNLVWVHVSPTWRGLPFARQHGTVAPFTDAVAVAAGLQWAGQPIRPFLVSPRFPDRTILAPFQPAPGFDPASFPWPGPLVLQRRLVRAGLLETIEPFSVVLYRPERLEWLPGGRGPLLQLAPNRLGWIVVYPLPYPSAAIVSGIVGKYKPEHDSALIDITAAIGFAAEHAQALADVEAARDFAADHARALQDIADAGI